MPLKRESIHGYEDFCSYVNSININGPPIFFYFSGDKLPTGESWCSDCNEAEPIVNAYLAECEPDAIFVHVTVGLRDYWKDLSCPFRTDPRLKLLVIPTIIRWKGVQRLEGSQCSNRDLLDMLFTEED